MGREQKPIPVVANGCFGRIAATRCQAGGESAWDRVRYCFASAPIVGAGGTALATREGGLSA